MNLLIVCIFKNLTSFKVVTVEPIVCSNYGRIVKVNENVNVNLNVNVVSLQATSCLYRKTVAISTQRPFFEDPGSHNQPPGAL